MLALTDTNERLDRKVVERRQAEEALRRSKEELELREEALRESEEKYRNLVKYAPAAIYEMDLQGTKFFSVNEAMCGILGYSREELLSLKPADLLDREGRLLFKERTRKKLAGEKIDETIEYRIRRKDGQWIFTSFNMGAYTYPNEKPSRVMAIGYDITERKRAEEVLRETHDELERRVQERTFQLTEAYETLQREVEERKQAEEHLIRIQKLEALGTLAGGVAHDFNNILAGIIGFTEMVMEDVTPDGPEHRRLELVLKGARRGRDLVRQILTFSRQTEQDRRPLALNQTVEEGLKFLRATLPSTIQIISRSSTDDDLILADPAKIYQVLMNLCTNAAQAMREKGGVLDISVSKTSLAEGDPAPVPEMMPGEYVVLEVRDTGPGINPETLERIFDPFFTTKKPGEGTGLGLSVVHGIVTSYGGCIAVESEPGKGTVFRLYLPKIMEQPGPEDQEALPLAGGKECLLLVDDEDILVELNKQRLSRLGYEVVATTSSLEALDIFRKEPDKFALVITDQTMPNLTGMDLAAELSKVKAHIPIILCTGNSDSVSSEQAREAGIKAFLLKPVAKREMAEAIRRVLDAKAPGSRDKPPGRPYRP